MDVPLATQSGISPKRQPGELGQPQGGVPHAHIAVVLDEVWTQENLNQPLGITARLTQSHSSDTHDAAKARTAKGTVPPFQVTILCLTSKSHMLREGAHVA